MVFESIVSFFEGLANSVPEEYRILVSLFIHTFFIAIYSIFIWKFYKFMAKRDIIELNLSQYNSSKYPSLEKFFAVLLYTLEYMIILPFLVLFWFAIFSMFLLVLSESQSAQQILLISAAIIASTRISAYISEDLSKDIAKILPFTVLAMFVLGNKFFDLESIFLKIYQIPLLFNHVLMFIIFIFVTEFVLRGIHSILQLIYSSSEGSGDDKQSSNKNVEN